MRTVDSPLPFAGLGLGFEGAPLPLAAVFAAGSPNTITITFDTPLFEDLLDDNRWTGRINDKTQTVNKATAIGFTVVLEVVDGAVDVGADVVSYDDATADVRGRFKEVPAVTFANLPVTGGP